MPPASTNEPIGTIREQLVQLHGDLGCLWYAMYETGAGNLPLAITLIEQIRDRGVVRRGPSGQPIDAEQRILSVQELRQRCNGLRAKLDALQSAIAAHGGRIDGFDSKDAWCAVSGIIIAPPTPDVYKTAMDALSTVLRNVEWCERGAGSDPESRPSLSEEKLPKFYYVEASGVAANSSRIRVVPPNTPAVLAAARNVRDALTAFAYPASDVTPYRSDPTMPRRFGIVVCEQRVRELLAALQENFGMRGDPEYRPPKHFVQAHGLTLEQDAALNTLWGEADAISHRVTAQDDADGIPGIQDDVWVEFMRAVELFERLCGETPDERTDVSGGETSRADGLRVEAAERKAYWCDNALSINANSEFDVLCRLNESFGEVVAYVELLKTIKPNDLVETIECIREVPPEVKTAVARIRGAFKAASAGVAIQSVRGIGYRLEISS